MALGTEELLFSETYTFHVNVWHGDIRYAGKLNLTPSKVSLEIMGEESETRQNELFWKNIDKLVCKDTNKIFLLLGLRLSKMHSRVIERRPLRSYFESCYEINFVILVPSDHGRSVTFETLQIYSSTLSAWLGSTKKQYAIARDQDEHDSLVEFAIPIEGIGTLGINYNLSMYSAPAQFKTGITFPPSLFLESGNELDAENVRVILNKLITLFTFLTGDEIAFEKICASYCHGNFMKRKATIYFPISHLKRRANRSAFFPLGHELTNNSLGLPELPLDIFQTYFKESRYQRFFEQYVRYRNLENVEERFLGYFRLLEALTTQKKHYLDENKLNKLSARAKPFLVKFFGDNKNVSSFLRNLPRFNASKYNTEKCLTDFFNSIPTGISTKWKYDKSILGKICTLRNDLSHANEHDLDSSSVAEFTTLIEVMLVIALLGKLRIDLTKVEKIIPRLHGYDLVLNSESQSW